MQYRSATSVPPVQHNRNLRIAFAASAGIIQRLLQIPVAFISVPLVLHALGVAGFGVWGAATSIAWLSYMLDFGLGNALVTLLPRALGSNQPGLARDYVTASLQSGLALAALLLLATAVTARFTSLLSPPFIVACAGIALNIPFAMGNEIWLGLQKGYGTSLWQLVNSLTTLACLVLGSLLHAGVTAMTAIIYGVMLAANLASLVHVLRAHPALRPRWRLHWQALHMVFTQGGMMFVITIASFCAYALDNVLALYWLGPDASAQMTIVMRVCTTATGLLGVVTQPFWPGFADAYAAADHGWIRRALPFGTFGIIALAVAGSAFIIAFGAPVLNWWLHQNLNLPRSLFWIMAAWIVAGSLSHMPGLLLHAALRLHPQILILSIVALAGLGLKYYAARWFGVGGILGVTALLWLCVAAPGYFYLAARTLQPPA